MGGTLGLLLITNYQLENSLREREKRKKEKRKEKKDNIYGGKYINSKYIRKNKKPGNYYKREIYYFETEIKKRQESRDNI